MTTGTPTRHPPRHTEPPALEVLDARKTYPATRHAPARAALDNVSLSIAPGEWTALLGPNGSGKSTLVRAITGAGSLDAGHVRIFGHGPADARRAALRTSVVFQSPGLDKLLTVRENLAAQAALFGLSRDADARIRAAADDLGFADRLDHRVATLSGGLARRVDLARALLNEPDLLILDEATAGLDLQARAAFFDVIANLRARRRSMTVLMTTHLMEEADLADRVVMMAAGRIVADDAPAALRARCGGRVLRARPAASELDHTAALLRDARLDVTASHGALIARPPASSPDADTNLGPPVAALLARNIPFEVAPPTLGDAYLLLTGESLDAPAPAPAAPRRTSRSA